MSKSAAKKLVKDINKRVGRRAATVASDLPVVVRIPSTIYSLDKAIGGGWPTGTPVMLEGHKGCGKTTLLFHLAGQARAVIDKPAAIINTEGPIEVQSDWASQCGLPDDTVIFSEGSLETVLDIARELIRSTQFSFIAIDSIAGMRPASEEDKGFEEGRSRGGRAVPINTFMCSIAGYLAQYDGEPYPLIVFTQHLYQSPGSPQAGFVKSGGRAQEYIPKLMLRLNRQGTDETDLKLKAGGKSSVHKDRTHHEIGWRIQKNQCGGKPEGSQGSFCLFIEDDIYKRGTFSDVNQAIVLGRMAGVITQAGSYYTYKDKRYHGIAQLAHVLEAADGIKECIDTYEEQVTAARQRVREGRATKASEAIPGDQDS